MKQKNIFSKSEGNAWFDRNTKSLNKCNYPDSDMVLVEMMNISDLPKNAKVLEIGCGDGARLNWLKEECNFDCYGLDPSEKAVELANKRGIKAYQGTADQLPFKTDEFDIVIFGFCLYLCDREDLFQISYEADRVLKKSSWLLILDFYSKTPRKVEYHHYSGLFSYKMDYRELFMWHPSYVTFSHKVFHHSEHSYTDDENEWVALSMLRKNLIDE